jgi:multiple sugar transport system permease protein
MSTPVDVPLEVPVLPRPEQPAAPDDATAPAVPEAGRVGTDTADRGLFSANDWRRPRLRRTVRLIHAGLVGLGLVVGLGPLAWVAKASITPTQDLLHAPMGFWPHGFDWGNLHAAWSDINLKLYFVNTVVIAAGSWVSQIVVATTAGYALSVLRPRYGGVLTALVLGTLLVPAIVLLVPLYLTILDVPFQHRSLINSFWAVWLPAGASAFNVILVKRFFDTLPRDVFEAARVDGAGPFRLFWSIVLPMSRPILGVVSVFAVLATWRDYLWPLLVLPDPN